MVKNCEKDPTKGEGMAGSLIYIQDANDWDERDSFLECGQEFSWTLDRIPQRTIVL